MDQPKRMTSLDRKIEAAQRRAATEKATHAIPQAVPTQGLTSEFSTAGCNIANQRKPAHGGRVTIDAAASAGSADPAPVFVVGQGPAAETVAEVIEAAAAGTQPSPEQIKAAIQERERTEAQLRATWEPQTRAQRLNRKAFSDGIAAGIAAQATPLRDAEAEKRIKLSNQLTVFLAWLANDPEIHETVVRRMRDHGVIPHDPASLPPQMGTLLMRIALPPPGSKVAAIGPGGLRFVVERSDKSVYLVMDGPGV